MSTTHNLYHCRLFARWKAMHERCYNVNNKNYSNYGFRGIKVCDEWLKTQYYSIDNKNKYSKNELNEIDRIHYFNFENHLRKYAEKYLKISLEDAIKQKYSIDRIDVNGNYSPKNTRLTTSIEQARNRRNSIQYKK